MKTKLTAKILLVPLLLLFIPFSLTAQENAGTDAEELVGIDALRVKMRPLMQEDLEKELDTWLDRLRSKITEVGDTEIKLQNLPEETSPDERQAMEKQLVDLRTEEVDLIERLKVVISALKAKGGDVTSAEQYLAAISDLENSADSSSQAMALLATARSWLRSPEGGIDLAKRLVMAVIILFAAWFLSRLMGRLVGRALGKRRVMSSLLTDFAKRMSGGVIFAIGIIMALGALGVSMAPMVAALGAGGFIVGFAMQETLGSFASGLMIMIYRPFDVDDYISVAGVEGRVEQMSLVSTTLLTIDNKVLIIPNKMVWGDTITNYTGRSERRVDLIFGIGYGDDIPRAREVLLEVAEAHELVLKEPELTVDVVELADSSVNLACRPWAKSTDYWRVYWDLMKEVKMRFDKEGISIPFPQRDVHMIQD